MTYLPTPGDLDSSGADLQCAPALARFESRCAGGTAVLDLIAARRRGWVRSAAPDA